MSTSFIIFLIIIGFCALTLICGVIEDCVKEVSRQNTERYRIYYENSIKNEISETAQSEDEK